MQTLYFIVHYQVSYEKHPDLIGFYVRTDLDGRPKRDKKNELIAESSMVSKIRSGDRIVYYTRGDHLIRGIFEVGEKVREDDNRRAKDWKHGLIQFTITPLLIPKSGVDFRAIIFSGKDTLDMFKHLGNLRKQWESSIGGKNYIKRITPHDYAIIERAIQETLEPEAKKDN